MMFRVLLLSIAVIGFIGCKYEDSNTINQVEYFDIHAALDSDIQALIEGDSRLIKESNWNGDVQTQEIDDVDWRRELSFITSIKIPIAAWKNDYNCSMENGRYSLSAKSQKTRLRKLDFSLENGRLQELKAVMFETNALKTSTLECAYESGSNYTYSIEQKTKTFKGENIIIAGQIIN